MKNNKGVILVLAVGTAVILSLLGGVFFFSSSVNQRLSERQRQIDQAEHNAEAGIERAIYELREDIVRPATLPASWYDDTINGLPAAGLNSASWTQFITGVPLNEGVYDIELARVAKDKDIKIRATGRVNGVNQSIVAYVTMKNLNMWDGAIFAGIGQGGGFINGHAEIHGSIHLLGEGKTSTQNTLELSGGAYMSNNYQSQQPPSFLSLLPPIDGDGVETLEAELRVKHGRVSLSGNSKVGEDNIYGVNLNNNPIKENLDGIFVSNGFDPNPPSAGSVFSDNGWQNGYDIGDDFPKDSLYYAHEGESSYFAYYDKNALVIVPPPGGLILSQGVAYTAPGSNSTNSLEMDDKGNIKIKGLVYVKGNLEIGKSGGGLETFTYSGRGAILADKNAAINGNFYAKGSFPQSNLICLMARNEMTLGKDPHSEMMGLFYAEEKITVNKQTNIAGTIIGNTFTMNQVPSIFQVPSTLDNLIPHTPGTKPYWVLKVVSWQKD